MTDTQADIYISLPHSNNVCKLLELFIKIKHLVAVNPGLSFVKCLFGLSSKWDFSVEVGIKFLTSIFEFRILNSRVE